MSQLGQNFPVFERRESVSSTPDSCRNRCTAEDFRLGPCVERLRAVKGNEHVAAAVGAAMCTAFVRLTRPLAIMPSADQVPVKTSHSTMLWPEWVVLITGSTRSALRAVCPFQPFFRAGAGAISSGLPTR